MSDIPEGWYTDPTNDQNERFWSGTAWSEQTRPMQASPAAPSPPSAGSASPQAGVPSPSMPGRPSPQIPPVPKDEESHTDEPPPWAAEVVTQQGLPPTAPTPPPTSSQKGFFGRLFDLSFTEFVTPSIIKLIFIIGIVLAALMSLLVFATFANQGGGAIVAGIVLAPLVFFVYVLFARVLSEVYLILFRIEENTRKD
jgi:hypothetical protein